MRCHALSKQIQNVSKANKSWKAVGLCRRKFFDLLFQILLQLDVATISLQDGVTDGGPWELLKVIHLCSDAQRCSASLCAKQKLRRTKSFDRKVLIVGCPSNHFWQNERHKMSPTRKMTGMGTETIFGSEFPQFQRPIPTFIDSFMSSRWVPSSCNLRWMWDWVTRPGNVSSIDSKFHLIILWKKGLLIQLAVDTSV